MPSDSAVPYKNKKSAFLKALWKNYVLIISQFEGEKMKMKLKKELVKRQVLSSKNGKTLVKLSDSIIHFQK